jgi:hypothetical protein
MDVENIVQKYDPARRPQQIGAHFGISKSRLANVLVSKASPTDAKA